MPRWERIAGDKLDERRYEGRRFWAVSIVAALRYARGYLGGYVPLIFGVMGAWMCLSRIVGGTHYPLDIIGGFVIGIVAGLIFVTIERRV